MRYLKAHWRHELPDEAAFWFHELDDERRESRKVVVFRDGRSERAGIGKTTDYAFLNSEPVPEVGDINSQTEFDAEQIDQAEFENAWVAAAPRSN